MFYHQRWPWFLLDVQWTLKNDFALLLEPYKTALNHYVMLTILFLQVSHEKYLWAMSRDGMETETRNRWARRTRTAAMAVPAVSES